MNILVVTPYLPYPPNSGGKAAQFSILKAYPSHYNIRLIYKAQSKEDKDNAIRLESQLKNVKVLLCDPIQESLEEVDPEGNDTLMRVLHFPARIAWKLLFIYESLINTLSHNREIKIADEPSYPPVPQLPVAAYHEVSTSVLNAIQVNLEWADLVQADFIDLLTLSCVAMGSKPKVYVVHQVHTSYVETFFDSTLVRDQEQLLVDYHCHLTHMLESTFLEKFDAIIVFSHEDKGKLKAMGVERPILVSPFTYPLDLRPADPKNLSHADWKRELVFIGSGEHGPNENGLQWFLDHVYPKLDQKKDGLGLGKPPLTVIGNWSPEQQLKLQQKGACFSGFVDDLSEAIKGRVCICPIQIGAGLRTKLLAAAISSSPIVSTSLGCQGMGMKHEEHCLIADSPSDFAAQVLRLVDGIDELGSVLAANAYSHVRSNFSLDAVARQRTEIFESLIKGQSV